MLELEEDGLRDGAGEGSSRTQKSLSPRTLRTLLNRENWDKPLTTRQTPPPGSCQMWLLGEGWGQTPPPLALLKARLRPGLPARRRKGRNGAAAVSGRKSRQPLPQALAALGSLSRCGQRR